MTAGALEHSMEEDPYHMLFFLVGPLNDGLSDWAPGAAESLLHVEQVPKLFHQSVHELLATIVGDQQGPSSGAAHALD